MLGMILAAGTGLLLFIYISILYLPIIAMKDERTGVKLARKKLRWLSRIVLKSLGVKLRVIYKNRKNINALEREKGIIFVCNHQSNLDIPVIVSALHIDVGFVAKKEMKSWPFFNIWMKRSKCVFLNRENPREGIKDIKEAVKVVKDGYPIVIFPEGERTLDGEILRFKKGSFKLATETNGIIVPLTLKGTFDIQKRGEWKMKRNQLVTIIVGEPIYVDSLSNDEIKELSTKVREVIEENYKKIK
ncbi:MAG: lysophospholipid acyltransferase family protein [Fusobacterium mortiferum]|jgi:1-acyl-sn-glycerol-3-phosphate acyltransferase|uniref:1-acyl-sn-glycerol-3-phosphate acyltransferase n=2 Tax=Fusobacterium mortiferum TaxID=850 RepID=A0A414PP11_FUSMR|nr:MULTISPECIES: lysophospholipid acyltransferase family protein [Fusobacterium]AVQ18181.1 1-acyl-sn-glycerol-3-phosphate acyltransferase [Fusobacterium mortiferum ATCC 9817]EEO36716.2 Acyltransferase [Fusobacterium mortiferum ATCC 9817]MCF2700225.1 1-acyl-sn-glycerol-3-phosphate acyltransferase [Fusobacterium mortiferum]MCI6382690.1 1-acyl-sn-glycerol-3-phosphate acyltransferase [Fusobacterium mortiferum]MCI7186855.1 1-acyl-sn-glycerol-3-phosphate acyltransferase [Fusobacterium mortiferum]